MTTPTMTITSMITTATAVMAGMEFAPVNVSKKESSQNEQNVQSDVHQAFFN